MTGREDGPNPLTIGCLVCGSTDVYPSWGNTVCRQCGYLDMDSDDPVRERAHFIYLAGAEARWLGVPEDQNPHLSEEAQGLWAEGWINEDKTHRMERRAAERRDLNFDPVADRTLGFLERSFAAGNRAALQEAIEICLRRCLPPSEWMATAMMAVFDHLDQAERKANKNKKPLTKHDKLVRELTRFLAVASILWKDSPAQWQALTGPGVSKELLSEWGLLNSYNEQSIALATQEVQRLGDIVDSQTVAKSYAKVKKDIERNRHNSIYIVDIDVASILEKLKADDLVARAEATIDDREFIPYRTDILP